MTTGVIFHAETPEQSLWGDIVGWRNVLKKLGVDFYYAIDTRGDLIAEGQPYKVRSLDEAIEKVKKDYPECKLVLLDNNATKSLKDFIKTEDVCYIFGPDGTFPFTKPDIESIKLNGDNLFAVVCAGIVLHNGG